MGQLKVRNLLLWPMLILALSYLIYYSQFKFIWHDETTILLHLSGYQPQELIEALYDGQPKTKDELLIYQKINHQKTWKDTFTSVIKASPTASPLYIFSLRAWSSVFGDSELALRSLSLLLWGFLMVSLYYLSWLLFADQRIALLSTILTMLSPRFIDYALDIWEYGLFALMTVLSSIFFQRFTQNQSDYLAIFYSLWLLMGLYSHIFFIFVILAHFLAFLLLQKSISFSPRKRFYFVSAIIHLTPFDMITNI